MSTMPAALQYAVAAGRNHVRRDRWMEKARDYAKRQDSRGVFRTVSYARSANWRAIVFMRDARKAHADDFAEAVADAMNAAFPLVTRRV